MGGEVIVTELAPRPVRESASDYLEIALPNDANPLGNLLGGRVMHLVDLAGALAAARHSRRPVVTASVDSMTFLHPSSHWAIDYFEVGGQSRISNVYGGWCQGVGGGSGYGCSPAYILGVSDVCRAGS